MRKRAHVPYGAIIAAVLCLASAAGAQGRRGPFLIRGGGNKCLDINGPQVQANGGRVQIWNCHGGPNQQWRMERGQLVSVANGRCLDLHGPDTGFNGARVQVWDCNGSPNQRWRLDGARITEQADGRCLDVHGPDMGKDGGHVQTWDCHGGQNQLWSIEPVGGAPPPPPPVVVVPPPPPAPPVGPPPGVDVEAGPLWNNGDAAQKCPAVCAPGRWNGSWRTTVPGRMSVCGCLGRAMVPPPAPVLGPGPMQGMRPMHEPRFEGLMQAINAESFSQGKIRVLEDAARSNYFVIAQLRRLIEAMSFSPDKIRAVEIVAPRLLDRQNSYTLYSVFTFDSDKQAARAILERN